MVRKKLKMVKKMEHFNYKEFSSVRKSKDSVYKNALLSGYAMVCRGQSIHTRVDFAITNTSEVGWVAKSLETASKKLFKLQENNKKNSQMSKVELILNSKIVLDEMRNEIKERVDYEQSRYLANIFRSAKLRK